MSYVEARNWFSKYTGNRIEYNALLLESKDGGVSAVESLYNRGAVKVEIYDNHSAVTKTLLVSLPEAANIRAWVLIDIGRMFDVQGLKWIDENAIRISLEQN